YHFDCIKTVGTFTNDLNIGMTSKILPDDGARRRFIIHYYSCVDRVIIHAFNFEEYIYELYKSRPRLLPPAVHLFQRGCVVYWQYVSVPDRFLPEMMHLHQNCCLPQQTSCCPS